MNRVLTTSVLAVMIIGALVGVAHFKLTADSNYLLYQDCRQDLKEERDTNAELLQKISPDTFPKQSTSTPAE